MKRLSLAIGLGVKFGAQVWITQVQQAGVESAWNK